MRDKLIELICEGLQSDGCIAHCNYSPCNEVKFIADHLIAHGVTFADVPDNNVGDKAEKLQKRIKALEKSNRNWRRKCQRLRNPPETTCEGCIWSNRKRPQKCSCCRRNRDMKDCYGVAT